MANTRIVILPGSHFTWTRDNNTHEHDLNPIQTLADHGLLHDNGLLSNKIIHYYGIFVFSDIEARMRQAELHQANFWRRFRCILLRKEPFDISNLATNYDKAVYTEREIAERMIKIIRTIQPIECLLNRPDLTQDELQKTLQTCEQQLKIYNEKQANLKFLYNLPALSNIIQDEKNDLVSLANAITRLRERLTQTIQNQFDCNLEIQKWLYKRFDQLNRGFERRIRNLNIYKAVANTGGLTLGRAYDTVQNVKELFRASEHYYAEVGRITPEMQHMPPVQHAGFSSKIYPLRQPAGDALKLAHYFENDGNYMQSQASYRRDKNNLLKQEKEKPAKLSLSIKISEYFFSIYHAFKNKIIEEIDFSFGNTWRTSTALNEKIEVLELLVSKNIPDNNSKPANQRENKLADTKMNLADAPGNLNLLSFGDVFTSTGKFAEQFSEFFAGHMSDKRPFSSIVAFTVYGFFGLTTFNPILAKSILNMVTHTLSVISHGHLKLSTESVLALITKECQFICKYLGADNSLGERIITNAFINMKGYLVLADSLNYASHAETGFIKEICELARNNCLTPKTFEDSLATYGIKLSVGLSLMMLGVILGVASHALGEYGFPLNKIIDISLSDLKRPAMFFGAAFSGALIVLKGVGAFNEAMHNLGAEVNKAGLPLEKNEVDYALLIVIIATNFTLLDDSTVTSKTKNQFERLLREYPGLIHHPLILPIAEKLHCNHKKSKIVDITWAVFQPIIIAITWLTSLPRLGFHYVHHYRNGEWLNDFEPAKRSFIRAPIAGWLLAKRLTTSGLTLIRMLTRLCIEVPYRFYNKSLICGDAVFTELHIIFRILISNHTHINAIKEPLQENYIRRCQNRNSDFVNFIGWLDDHIGKPSVNNLLRKAEHMTQVLLATGTTSSEARKKAYNNALAISQKESMHIYDSKPIKDTTTKVFNFFNINKDFSYPEELQKLAPLSTQQVQIADAEQMQPEQNKDEEKITKLVML